MKNTMIVISDYTEGEPVVASVRFEGLMRHFQEQYRLVVISDGKHGARPSRFSNIHLAYASPVSSFTQTLKDGENAVRKHPLKDRAEKLLRNKWVLSAWRNYRYSRFKFVRINPALFRQLDQLMEQQEIQAVFVTVPDVYGLYILDYIKAKCPGVPAIIEIRDIINHSIGEGHPRLTYRLAEAKLARLADGVVAVSQGIVRHYQSGTDRIPVVLIKNGFDDTQFTDCRYLPFTSGPPESLSLVHLGSIYKGRNLKSLIEGLRAYHLQSGVRIRFDLIGLLDQQAYEDLHSVDLTGIGVNVRVLGSMDHEKAVQRLKEADIAVILTHPRGSDYAIPGKTFEYIGACKPILAVTRDPELISLVDGRYGECCAHDAEAVASGMNRVIDGHYDFSDRGRYSRSRQAQCLLDFIGDISRVAQGERTFRAPRPLP
ncbi:hypothetical protein BCV73_05910 [Paenibacillus sp. SSG-1]|uniref:Uncharacterized protein n=1 Tax=Paenibacillus cineris TaxID=237530 RepID=A0ABQ4L9S0_9BACL|nr:MULTISPECIES: hypothetical protein [Paenibacillus]OXL82670.1 hypothetical protein BCV73_05910 [Paenibacillus sp. SSG-1]GIO53030.1 hypothetical protein J21TS7_13480 [Paenibacillus cineris]